MEKHQSQIRGLHETWPKQIILQADNEGAKMTYYCPKVWFAHKMHRLRQLLRGRKRAVMFDPPISDRVWPATLLGGGSYDRKDWLSLRPGRRALQDI